MAGLKFEIDIWNSLWKYALFRTGDISLIFLIITFDRIWNFKLWWLHRKDLVQIYQSQPYLKLKKYCSIYKNKFVDEKIRFFLGFYCIFFSSSSVQRYVNPDDCIRKISRSIRSNPNFTHYLWRNFQIPRLTTNFTCNKIHFRTGKRICKLNFNFG